MNNVSTLLLRTIVMPAIKRALPGYSGSGQTLRRQVNDVDHIIHLQTSKSAQSVRSYTLNLGVLSRSIFKVKWSYDGKRTISDCHWQKRIGCYRHDQCDMWWRLRNEEDAKQSIIECVPLLECGLAEMSKLDSTQSLLEYWQGGGWSTHLLGGRDLYIRLAKQVLSAASA
jgi:hypothetical protein